MRQKKKVYIVSQPHYLAPFADMMEQVEELHKADIALFTGGEDVDPYLYGESKGKFTFSNILRDQREAGLFAKCQEWNIPTLGICRGSQFLTVQSGGKLIQDVTNHGKTHEIFTKGYGNAFVSSTHHQMMNPFGLIPGAFEILGWSEGLSVNYLNGENKDNKEFKDRGIEPEIVWYKKTKALAIQCHPEIMPRGSKGVNICRQLVRDLLL